MAFIWRQKKEVGPCVHQLQGPPTADLPTVEDKTSPNQVLHNDVTEVNTTNDRAQPSVLPGGRDSKGRCQMCRSEQLAARRYRTRLVIGLFCPFALQALDVTIVASALPWIASDFNEISQMNWIISAFNLTSACFIPMWGQIADILGRHVAVEMALLMMMIGSALCTSAPLNTFPLLIFGRALQGLACAGINVCCRVILADKVSLKEYSKNFSIFSFFAGISYAIGPLIGGFLTDKNWRWCFGINIPVAVLGVILVVLVLRSELLGPQPLPELLRQDGGQSQETSTQTFVTRLSTIDYGGQLLFLFGMGLLILALTWGGASYKWDNPHVLVPLILGVILTSCFICWQYMMAPARFLARKFPVQRPTIPWRLLSQRNMSLLFYINFATGMAMIAVLYFVDIYFTLVKAFTPSQAGIQLLYYTPGIGVGVYLAMYLCNIYPRQTFHPLFLGSLVEALGITILAWALYHEHNATIFGMMALTGCGTGLRFMPGSLHGIGFFPNDLASMLSMMAFAIPLGGTFAMTLMDTVFNNKSAISISSSHSSSGQIQAISNLPPEVQDTLRHSAKMGVVYAFIAIAPFNWLCVLAAAGLGNVQITKNRKVDGKSGKVDFSENVTEGSYLGALLKRGFGKGKEKKQVEGGGKEDEKGKEPVVAVDETGEAV